MKDREKRIILLLTMFTIIFTMLGGTFAYFRWATSNEQNTNVTFTVTPNFSCSGDGGGTISSNEIRLEPTECTNTENVIRREVNLSTTSRLDNANIYFNLWLDVINIGSGLTNSENLKYTISTTDSCTENIVNSGNFKDVTNNGRVNLLEERTFVGATTETLYLYIWLDAKEESTSTMNQSFTLEYGGSCTNQAPNEQTVYTVNLYDENATGLNSVWQGQPISNSITTYNTPEAAITALETVYSNANSGATTSLPFFLKHTVSDGTLWCANEYDNGVANGNSFCAFPSQAACNSRISEWEYDNITYTCVENTFTGGVSESYVGFVVTPTMAANNPGMVAGTYYLRGGDNGASFVDNAKTIYDAFGGVGCYLDGNSGGNPYTTTPSSYFNCVVSGLDADANANGNVCADVSMGSYCVVDNYGISYCNVDEDGGLL